MPVWELLEYSERGLEAVTTKEGHFTIKVDPLADKQLLHKYGFYYCDTLIVPRCTIDRFKSVQHPKTSISKQFDSQKVLSICDGAFSFGRFHRDFHLPKASADRRYNNWLKQLIDKQQVFGLYWQDMLAGFVGCDKNCLVLHAVKDEYRGEGLAKYWWSEVCRELFVSGFSDIVSSVSSANLAAINLYASLGFTFSESMDVYHRLVTKTRY